MSGAFRLLAAGSSPGEALVAGIDGIPAGLPPAQRHLEEDRARRRRHDDDTYLASLKTW
jgi:chorismate synthase